MNKSDLNYIDGFVLPIPKKHLNQYKDIAQQIADIWKEYGAISYFEYFGDDLALEGTRSFIDVVGSRDDESIIFGWVVFPSKEIRDTANEQVPKDPRMSNLVAPLTDSDSLIFDASRMVYGGFRLLVNSE